MIHQAERMAEVRSDIRGPLYEEALRMQREGIQVLKLNTGNPGIFG
ncbi:MAG: aminotransferase, partial [Clostridiales bacterium]|nr:aminotransferase [Clostridiales bacterium]